MERAGGAGGEAGRGKCGARADAVPREDAAGGAEDTFTLLRTAGLEQWRSVAWQSSEGERLSLLSMAGVGVDDLVYLSPESPNVLNELRPSDCCIALGTRHYTAERA